MRNFELEFYDRLQYWHRLQEKVVRIMKKSVWSECRVQNSNCQAANRGALVCKTKCWFIRAVTPNPSLSVLATFYVGDLPPKKKPSSFSGYSRVISAREDEILIDSQPILHPYNYACKGDKGNFNKPSSFSFEIPLF